MKKQELIAFIKKHTHSDMTRMEMFKACKKAGMEMSWHGFKRFLPIGMNWCPIEKRIRWRD